MDNWFQVEKNKTVIECDESIDRLSYIIKQTRALDVVQDVDDWDWKKRFPNLESATNLLLKQLKIQRDILFLFYQDKYRQLVEKQKQLVNKTKEE